MGNVTVRFGRLEDAAAVAEIHVAAWKAAYQGLLPDRILNSLDVSTSTANWQRWLTASLRSEPTPGGETSHRLLVAVAHERVLGWAAFGEARDEDLLGWGELAGIYVHPRAWSQGAGHGLIARVEEELAAMGFQNAYLWVLAGNDRAIAFYERHQWHGDGVHKIGSAGGATGLRELRHSIQLGAKE